MAADEGEATRVDAQSEVHVLDVVVVLHKDFLDILLLGGVLDHTTEFRVSEILVIRLCQQFWRVSLPILEDVSFSHPHVRVFRTTCHGWQWLSPDTNVSLVEVGLIVVQYQVIILAHVHVSTANIHCFWVESYKVVTTDNSCLPVLFFQEISYDGTPDRGQFVAVIMCLNTRFVELLLPICHLLN